MAVTAPGPRAMLLLDAAVGLGVVTAGVGARGVRAAGAVVGPLARGLARPPGVPERYRPERLVRAAAARGRAGRLAARDEAVRAVHALVPRIVDAVLDQIDLTRLVAGRVDLDALVSLVDVDAVVARADVDAVVARANLDAILDRVDVDGIAARLDLDAVAARLDVDAVIDRVDLVGLTRDVLEAIDLPAIIQQSSGAMASETVRGLRLQSIDADDLVNRAVDRLLLRRGPRRTQAEVLLEPVEPAESPTQEPRPPGDEP